MKYKLLFGLLLSLANLNIVAAAESACLCGSLCGIAGLIAGTNLGYEEAKREACMASNANGFAQAPGLVTVPRNSVDPKAKMFQHRRRRHSNKSESGSKSE